MTVADQVRVAAADIREKGHCKGRLQDDQGRLCMSGALRGQGQVLLVSQDLIPGQGQDAITLYGCLQDVIREQFPERVASWQHWNIVMFNDHADTTAEEVISVLEKAAARIEGVMRHGPGQEG